MWDATWFLLYNYARLLGKVLKGSILLIWDKQQFEISFEETLYRGKNKMKINQFYMGIVSRRVDKRQVEAMWKLVGSLRVKSLYMFGLLHFITLLNTHCLFSGSSKYNCWMLEKLSMWLNFPSIQLLYSKSSLNKKWVSNNAMFKQYTPYIHTFSHSISISDNQC